MKVMHIVALLILAAASGVQSTGETGWKGDPVFTGFDGQAFDLLGQPGRSYAILSTADLTVNAELVAAGPEYKGHEDGVEGTFVGGVSVFLPGLEVVAHVDVAGNATLLVNNLELDIESPASFNKGKFTYQPYVPDHGQVITVEQQPFRLIFTTNKQLTDPVTGYSRGHFELGAQLSGPAGAVKAGGILGVTLGSPTGLEASRDASLYEIRSLSDRAQPRTAGATRRLLSAHA